LLWRHALSLFGDIKYPADFKRFDYVNPDAPKGGIARMISGGKLLTPEEKDLLDDWYIRHASYRLDLTILARTVWVVIRGDRRNEGAIDTVSIAGPLPTNNP
jgi:Bacterial sugar transferase